MFVFCDVTQESGKERHITQIQYISWPDHGVPDDASDFLHFVMRVRQRRSGMTEPTIVHCRCVATSLLYMYMYIV